ncbi:hypothetical protein TrRE_jg4398 [Triparma retinervis]|uniref:Kinesin motor domain-containing protein n=1 Tax=Triparma retinervis TaxID=2557542 RepID=A0A9W7F5S7_9STRA|nr:hypothetical protein TrRE_jg4398 [Triparma retinervis]
MLARIGESFGSASAYVTQTAFDLTDRVHSTLLEIDQTEKELQSGKANWKGDVDGIRDVVVEWKMEVEKMGREYQRIVVEKELEVEELKKKLAADKSEPSSPVSEADRLKRALGDDSSILYAVEQLKLENSVLEDTVSAWEGKMKSLLRCKTDDAVEKRKMQFKIEEMEREMERRLEAERRGREASDSPRRSSTGGGKKGGADGKEEAAASNDETVDNLVQEYTQLVYSSQVKEDELNKTIGDLKRAVEELMVKNQAQESNILMLMQKGGEEEEEVAGGRGGGGAREAELKTRAERAEEELRKVRESKENVGGIGAVEAEGMKAELASMKAKLQAAHEEVQKARATPPLPPSQEASSEGAFAELKNQLEKAVAGKAEAEGIRGNLEVEKESMKAEIDVLNEKFLALVLEKEAAEGSGSKAEAELGATKLEVEKLSDKVRALEEEKDHLTKEAEAMSSGGDERVQKFEKIIKDLESEKEGLRAEKAKALEEFGAQKDGEREKALEDLRSAKDGEREKALEELGADKDGEKNKALVEMIAEKDGQREKALEELRAEKDGERGRISEDLGAAMEGEIEKSAKALEKLGAEKDGEREKALEELRTEKDGEKEKALADLTSSKEGENAAALEDLTSSKDEEKAKVLSDLTTSKDEEKAKALADLTSSKDDEKAKALSDLTTSKDEEKAKALADLTSSKDEEKVAALADLTSSKDEEKAKALSELTATKDDEKAKALSELTATKDDEKAKALSELTATKDDEKAKALSELTASKDEEMQNAIKQGQEVLAKTKDDYEKKIHWFQEKTTELVAKHKEEVGKLTEELTTIEATCNERHRIATDEAAAAALKEKEDAVEAMRQSQLDQIASANSERDECKELYMKEAARRKVVHNKLIELQGNIRVIARVRPIVDAERNSGTEGNKEVVVCTTAEDLVVHRDITTRTRFEFDRVCDQDSSQDDAYELVSPLVTSVLDGYNVCIFAYGQTGSGKTYTMEGPPENRGVNYKAIAEMFKVEKEREEDVAYSFRVSMLEIYNETVRDLLNPAVDEFKQPKVLNIRTTDEGNIVQGLTEVIVNNESEVFEAMGKGTANRSVGSHSMNLHSSRSHLIVSVNVSGVDKHNGVKSKGKLHLIDLAGSERIGKTDATGDRLKEAQAINNSLSALGNVINALGSKKPGHVPYRNSKLTFLLADSLGGNSKVMMFVNLSPVFYNMGESLCSLTFASRCRAVNLGNSKKNDDKDKREIKRLQNVLRTNGISSKGAVNK